VRRRGTHGPAGDIMRGRKETAKQNKACMLLVLIWTVTTLHYPSPNWTASTQSNSARG
jgi:hypothetical protein